MVPCSRCKRNFTSLDDYEMHLVGCVLRARMFRHQQYRERDTRDPLLAQRAVMRSADFHPVDRAQLGYEDEASAIDAGLRTGRIRTVQFELDPPTIGNWWRRMWRRIRGNN